MDEYENLYKVKVIFHYQVSTIIHHNTVMVVYISIDFYLFFDCPTLQDLSDVSTLGYPSSLYPTKGIHIRHVPRN